jgi:hypothetical protein
LGEEWILQYAEQSKKEVSIEKKITSKMANSIIGSEFYLESMESYFLETI